MGGLTWDEREQEWVLDESRGVVYDAIKQGWFIFRVAPGPRTQTHGQVYEHIRESGVLDYCVCDGCRGVMARWRPDQRPVPDAGDLDFDLLADTLAKMTGGT